MTKFMPQMLQLVLREAAGEGLDRSPRHLHAPPDQSTLLGVDFQTKMTPGPVQEELLLPLVTLQGQLMLSRMLSRSMWMAPHGILDVELHCSSIHPRNRLLSLSHDSAPEGDHMNPLHSLLHVRHGHVLVLFVTSVKLYDLIRRP